MSDTKTSIGSEMFIARKATKDSVAFGTALLVMGFFAVLAPLFGGIAVTVLVGMLLAGAGIAALTYTIRSDTFGEGLLRFLFGALSILAGIATFAMPERSLAVLAILLAAYLAAVGVVDVIIALSGRHAGGRGWMLFSGIVSILLGGLILAQWPVSGVWAVGLFVGIRVLMQGWALMALGNTSQDMLTNLQDTRIDTLESHVRNGATALQETQAVLAAHTTMLLALEEELRTKVSESDVDPAMKELNEKLGVARERMRDASTAAEETWDRAQREANAAFDQVRESAAAITTRLVEGLGGLRRKQSGAESAE